MNQTIANVMIDMPRLPTRYELLMWVGSNDEMPARRMLGEPPTEYDLSANGCSVHLGDGIAPCPVSEYLRRRYALKSVEADGWDLFVGTGHGITVAFDVDDAPAAKGLARAFAILVDLGIRTVTREELADILKDWESPHHVADRIKHKRAFDA